MIKRWELMDQSSDWNALLAFDSLCYPPALCVDIDWYENAYKLGYISWLLWVNDQIVGNVQLRLHEENTYYISGIATRPDWQEKGIGRMLINKVIMDYEDYLLMARIQDHNIKSKNLFISSAFKWTHDSDDEHGRWEWYCRFCGDR